MTVRATPKLAVLVAVAATCVLLGLGLGLPEMIALATPAIAGAALGVAASDQPDVTAGFALEAERMVEGEEVVAAVTLRSARSVGEIEVGLQLPPRVEAVGERRWTVSLTGGRDERLEVRLRPDRWGAYRLGLVAVRVRAPGNLIVHERLFDHRVSLKVYPQYERMLRAPMPVETQPYSGDYVARLAGDGIEFANVRPFARGDRVRQINWRVTSRTDELHVNLAHRERDADVAIFLDAFNDVDLGGETTLDLAVRGAAAVAQHHLRHNDRVGLVGFGGVMRWLTASMGRTHLYRIADFLLDLEATFSYAWKNIDRLPEKTLPPDALVMAFSPLVDRRSLTALGDISARGFQVVVVNTLDERRVAPAPGPEGALAHRAWLLERAATKSSLRSAGVPVATWRANESLEAVLASLPRRARRLTGARR